MKTAAFILICSAASLSAATFYSNDFSVNGGGFSVSSSANMGALNGWVSNPGVWSANGESVLGAASDSTLTSPVITVGGTGPVSLSFDHRFNFEFDGTRWDGGQVRVSVNGGAFTAVSNAQLTNGYTGVITGSGILNSQEGFNGISAGWATGAYITTDANLGTFTAGTQLQVQFVASWDEFQRGTPDNSLPGWELNSVTVNGVPEPGSALLLLGSLAMVARRRRA